ncbi:DUF2269 family protein [Thiorhodococcus minor]|uniref:DUF2269 family protein n=1 Tax=Thiorhodococcus minor TaxID=57489 RepID=A0A6M0K6E0_9GAMM|nr:DUF2269 family protein [Thiorhodococcus minor]NEV65338.1 DUF2269 family protein [Thiorhodococcus minor]
MIHTLLNFLHHLGVIILASGLIGAWLAEWLSREVISLHGYLEAVRSMRALHDLSVLPGGVLIIASGGSLIALYHNGTNALAQPWLLGMAVLFLFELFIINRLTWPHAKRLEWLAGDDLIAGRLSRELVQAQEQLLPRLAHALDVPILIVILGLGVYRPQSLDSLLVATLFAVFTAGLLVYVLPCSRPFRTVCPNAGELAR